MIDQKITRPQDWTTSEMAKETGFNQSYFRRQLLEGKLKGIKRGHIWLVSDREFRQWLIDHHKSKKFFCLTVNCFVTVCCPSGLISAESLRQILGQREGLSISASSRVLRRSIPLTVNGRASALFLSSVSWLKPSGLDDQAYQARGAPATAYLPDQFTVTVDGLPYTLQLPQIQDFLYTAWRRQRAGLPGLSRFYWTEERRPERFNRQLYDALMVLLSSVEGLIVDRGERRSGRLAAPPQLSIRAIQGVLGLG